MLLRPAFVQVPVVKMMINIGALLDIPTGTYEQGKYGESILNGGLSLTTGIVGIGNNFKSTIANYMELSAMEKVLQVIDTSYDTYDTEVNIHISRLKTFLNRFPFLKRLDILGKGIWVITDRTIYFGNKWFEILKEYLRDKVVNKKKLEVETPFIDRNGELLKVISPTFGIVDSFTRFETEDVGKIQDENELGDSGGNTIHMRQGLAKTRFLMELPSLCGSSYHYLILTAHVGKDGPAMQQGPMPAPPIKKLQYLKNGDKIKGVTEQFTFLLGNCWHSYNGAPLINQGTKGPEYPRNQEDDLKGDTDLNIVSLRQLRGKSGQSGIVIELIVSQSDGVLAELSEFHFIKTNGRYGLEGNDRNYSLALYPDCSLSRTTVRGKLDNDAKLRRAMNITAEMCQMKMFWHNISSDVLCTPKELYDDLKAQGYDWDVLLNTRGYWMFNNDKQPIPFLSTLDLLHMRKGVYFPYWMEEDKKTIKKEFLIQKTES